MIANSLLSHRILLVQWSGDYRDAYHRLETSGAENYYAQRYSIDQAGEMAHRYAAYGVLCLTAAERYDEEMPNGVRAMGAGLCESDRMSLSGALEMIAQFRPTHLVVTTPRREILEWGLARDVNVLPMFADTFVLDTVGLSLPRRIVKTYKHKIRCGRLARIINDPRVRWASNHNTSACRDLVRIGVDKKKIVPWDWPAIVSPSNYDSKSISNHNNELNLVFVGSLVPSKGPGDAIRAVAELRKLGRAVRLRVIGRGDDQPFRREAAAAGVADAVDFEGPRSHAEVITAFRAAEIALVPSWHAYPEGLPMAIYEAMAVRTPVVCSDHPAFCNRVGHGVSALCVPERSPAELARAIESILSDPKRYAQMSEATAGTWAKLNCPVTYYELIQRWVSGNPDDECWLESFSLASGRYN